MAPIAFYAGHAILPNVRDVTNVLNYQRELCVARMGVCFVFFGREGVSEMFWDLRRILVW